MRRRSRSASSCSAMAARKRAAGQPSLSAVSANCGHNVLIGGQAQLVEEEAQPCGVDRRLSGLSRSCGVSHLASLEEGFIGSEAAARATIDVRQLRWIGREVCAQGRHVRQLRWRRRCGGERLGQFGLAAALMGEREQDRP